MQPERIVSLVPSLTEALFTFGVGSRVVGRTRYCTQPSRLVGRAAKVGGTKKVDVERVLSLEPDLVVAVREENTREDIEGIEEAGVPIFAGAPETVADAVGMLRKLAERVGAPEAEVVLGPEAAADAGADGGDGELPAPGRYVVLAEALGAGLRYEDAPRLVVEVRAESEGDP